MSAFTPRLPMEGEVDFAPGYAPRTGLTHALFDFDGTLSLIREGWVPVMTSMFAEIVPAVPGESDEQREQLCREDILRLNGKQTIYQMIQLAGRVTERGGQPREPLWYKHEYLRRLDERIRHRLDGLRQGAIPPDSLVVHGARAFLDQLRARGIPMYLASGTDEVFVKAEVALLGLDGYFGRHVYGAQDDYQQFSKKMVIERILRENNIPGASLLSFGDGYVEIENTKAAGGFAVAIASDEANNGSGRFDEWKRQRLAGVGADIVVPDFRGGAALFERIFGA